MSMPAPPSDPTISPGAVVARPGGSEHTIRNGSGAEARAFVVMAPGAAMERFVREAASLRAPGGDARAGVLALASAHGIEMTRPIEETV